MSKYDSSDNEAILSIDKVTKSYGEIKALDGITLRLSAGEFVALLGPNGAGKTTLFQLLSGLFVSDGGSILIEGMDIRRHASKVLADIGVVFQQPTLDLDLTVHANLVFHARLHGMNNHRTSLRLDEELERLGLQESVGQSCRSLSGGNRRKVELARALLHQPKLLLMDEATVGLDPASRRSLVDDVHQFCKQRRMAVLWATHLVDEAERADRVLVLHRGRVVSQGTPKELIEQTTQASLADAFLRLTGEHKN